MSVKIFFCYAREDEELLKKLKSHLRPLQRQGLIDTWHDREINAGTEWEEEIRRQLNSAQIILLLISPDFMNSDYCYSKEMQSALVRHERGEARVIPVILRPVYWQGLLGNLQVLPTDATSIMSASWHNLDEALLDVVLGIRKVIERFFPQEVQLLELSLLKEEYKINVSLEVSAWGVKVFVIGRPGSGKTTAIRYLAQELENRGWLTTCINEYEILNNKFQSDGEHRKFISTEYGGFDILDFTVFDEASKEIESSIQRLSRYKNVVIVELERNEYKATFQQFDSKLVRNSYFLFVDADVETCIRRIHKRVLNTKTQDDYFVSDEMLRRFYHKDNWEYMTHQFHRDFAITKNVLSTKNMGSRQEFLERVKVFAKLIDDRENHHMVVRCLIIL
jgi:GTPase SAR1 family protein